MGPNDVDVLRVFTRNTGASTGDIAFPTGTSFQIVVDAEAGATAHGTGGAFEVGVVLRDLTACAVLPVPAPVPPTPASATSSSFGSPSWPAPGSIQFVYTVPAATIAPLEDHVLEVIAWLRYGIASPDVSFAVSPMFIITRP